MIPEAVLFDVPLETDRPINVACVPQRSPFRYPGGKTWFVPYIRRWLRSLGRRPGRFFEPFAGGGIVGLTVAFDDSADQVTLVELDPDISAVWKMILSRRGHELAGRVRSFGASAESARRILGGKPKRSVDRAFQTLLRNRLQHGGILAPGASLMKQGENGKGLFSRWYPETLQRRILGIHDLRDRIRFVRGDALEFIAQHRHDTHAIWFFDPPYTVAGRRLYKHSEVDHRRLFDLARSLKGGFLMTYDDADEIRILASAHRFETATVAMQSRQLATKYELVIGRDLRWMRT